MSIISFVIELITQEKHRDQAFTTALTWEPKADLTKHFGWKAPLARNLWIIYG